MWGLVVLLAAATAHADAYDAAMAQGAAAKEHALDVNDAGSWEEALTRFLDADALRATKESKYELGFAAAHLREDDLAVEAYGQAIALGLTGPAQTKAAAFVAEQSPKMARVAVKGPPGAAVIVGRRKRGTLPLAAPLIVFPGVVRVRISTASGTVDKEIDVKEGAVGELDFSAAPAPVPSASVTAAPTTSVSTPPPVIDAPPPVVARNPSSGGLGWTFVAIGGGVAVVSAVTFGIASATVAGRRDALSQSCDHPDGDRCLSTADFKREDAQSDSNALATWKPMRTVSAIGFGVGLAVVAIGVVDLVGGHASSDDTASTKRRAWDKWSASVTPTSGGAYFSTGFHF
ncbi:MAG: hypothetical protein ABI175_27195 [Polyangiales bacterium]